MLFFILSVRTAVIRRHISTPGRRARTSERPRRRHVGVIKAWRGRQRSTRIIELIIGTARGREVINPGARRGAAAISISVVVFSAKGDGGALAVVVARAVASGWRGESPVVVINGWVASSRGAGPVGFTVGVGLNIRDAVHSGSFELALIELLHGGLQIIGGFKFNKPSSKITPGL